MFFVSGVFLSEKVCLLKKSNGNAPPSLTKDSFFLLATGEASSSHWLVNDAPALFTCQGKVDRPNQKISPALDVLKFCTMTQWHFYFCLSNHANLNMPRWDEKAPSASWWLPLHTETFRNHLGAPCGACEHKGGCSWISRIHFDSSVVSIWRKCGTRAGCFMSIDDGTCDRAVVERWT